MRGLSSSPHLFSLIHHHIHPGVPTLGPTSPPPGVQFQLNVPQGYALTHQQVKVRLAWSARLVAEEGVQLPGEPEPVGEVK